MIRFVLVKTGYGYLDLHVSVKILILTSLTKKKKNNFHKQVTKATVMDIHQ